MKWYLFKSEVFIVFLLLLLLSLLLLIRFLQALECIELIYLNTKFRVICINFLLGNFRLVVTKNELSKCSIIKSKGGLATAPKVSLSILEAILLGIFWFVF